MALVPDATLSDSDSTTLKRITVTLAATPDGAAEVLSATDLPSGITAAYDAATRTLTLSGTANITDYQAALRLVKYANSSDAPSTVDRGFTITITDAQDNNSATTTGRLTVTAVNDTPTLTAPDDITLTDTAAVDSFTGQTGTLTASDPDSGSLTYGISTGQAATHTADGISYDLSKAGTYGTLYLNSSTGAYLYVPNTNAIQALKDAQTDSFTLTVTDGVVITPTSQTLTIRVDGANDAPVINSAATASVAEGTVTVTTVTATDVEGDSISYSIAGGADGALFTIDATTGVLSFAAAPDFETKADADQDGVYQVTVQASDGQESSTQTIAVTVTNINDAPTLTSTANPAATVAANSSDPSTRLFSGSSISTVEAGQLLTRLTLTVGGISDGAQERLVINAQTVALTAGNSVGGAGQPSIAVAVNGTTATVTVDFSQGISAADLASLINAITYANQAPTASGQRTVTLTALRDDGGTAQGGQDTASLSIATSVTIQPDTTPPGTPTITSGPLTNDATPVLTGTAEAGSTLDINVSGARYQVQADGDGQWTVDLGAATPSSGILTLNSNGTNAVSVTATDAADNSSAPGTQSLVIDTTPPGIPVTTSGPLTNDATPVLTGTAEAGSTVDINVGGTRYQVQAGGDGQWTLDLGAATPSSGTLTLNSNGTNAVSVTATDAAGNSSAPGTQSLVIDTTPPGIPVITSGPLTNDATPVLTGTAEAGSTVDINVGGARYQVQADGDGQWTVDLGAATPSSGILTLNSNGTNAVSVTATDAAGNSSAPGTQELRVDTLAPTLTGARFANPQMQVGSTGDVAFTISGGEAGATYHWTITASSGGSISGTGVMGGPEARITGVDLRSFAEGTLTLSVTLTDPAGNRSPVTTGTATIVSATPGPIDPEPEALIDGTKVTGTTTTRPDGTTTTTVVIDAPTPSRQDDPTTPSSTTADIPVVREQVFDAQTGQMQTVTTLMIGVPAGVTVTSAGSGHRTDPGRSLTDLIREIEARTDAQDSARVDLSGGATGFLSSLASNSMLLVRSVDIGGEGGTTAITGNSPASDQPIALVVNSTNAHGPVTVQLDHVDFAAIIGEATIVGGAGAQVVHGDNASQTMILGPGDDELHGGGGNDTVASTLGNDSLFGDDGDDLLHGGAGDDWLLGGADNDLIGGGDGNDRGFGGTGNDILFGEEGDDVLTGDAGNDTIDGGTGDDILFGGDGDDWLHGGSGADTLSAGAGNDTGLGGAGDDLIGLGDGSDLGVGGDGDDILFGEAGNDTLMGGAGADMIDGGAGDDLIFADGGGDTIWGGAGHDTFALGATSGGTVIADFNIGQDRLALYDASLDLGSIIAKARVVDGNTLLDMGDGQIVTIIGRTGDVANWFLDPMGA
ncbi:Ig-like domain-containing protein [Niveispirillum sp.]|uniref:beta strand repeat-containing protein n=1 Tax=Niveispirillum sp. TaxID=1917217 RepID=UPI001B7245C9|nr:Ig-like domain-containing protein [Niveispirillum sp.]MBP7335502.1 VCBS domain-containing protein [Niveispirillum sp.]